MVLLPFHAFFTVWVASNTGHFDFVRVWKELILIALTPLVLYLVLKNKAVFKSLCDSWIVRAIAIYTLLNIGMGLWAYSTDRVNSHALMYGLIVNLRFLFFFLACAVVAYSDNFLKKYWKKILLVPGLVVILLGLCQQFLLPHDFLRHFGYSKDTIAAYQTVDSNLDYRRVQSTLRGANPLGAYLVLILPAIVLALSRRPKLRVLGLAGGLVVTFYTYSRSAWIGLILSFLTLVSLIKNNFWNRQRLLTAGSITVVAVGVGLYFVQHNKTTQDTLLHTSDTSSSPISSNEARLQSLKSGLDDVMSEPFGEGTGTAGPASIRNTKPRIAENYYLQIGQEIGVLGMLLFIVINCLVGYRLWVNKNEVLAKILLASLVGISFINLLSHAWTDDTLSYLWWGLAGIMLSADILGTRHKQHGKEKNQAATT
jgi:O-antigen ligase